MKNIESWIQLTATLAVLVGLGLVIYELRQTKQIAVAELLTAGWQNQVQVDAGLIGDGLAETMARIADPKAKITLDDVIRYDGWVVGILHHFRLQAQLRSVGLPTSNFDASKNTFFACYYFGHDVGRAYLDSWIPGQDEVATNLRSALAGGCEDFQDYRQYWLTALPESRLER